MDFCSEFKGKKITVMGLGLLGRGVGDVAYLAKCGADLIVTDLKTEELLRESVEKLRDFSNIAFVLGEHRMEDFRDRDMVLEAAGVPFDSPYIAEAKKNGIPVRMSGAIFAKLSGIPIFGVTGTRGKSTVTHMIHHALSESTDGEILLGGNVRGVSNLELLEKMTEESVAVMELDSWQLQGFREEKISPQIAVFTTFMPDHLNYYHNDLDTYFADKANIFLRQGPGDALVTTPAVFKRIEQLAATRGVTLEQEIVLVDVSALPDDIVLQVPGEHNRLNAALAAAALRAGGVSEAQIKAGLESFRGLPGRLEFLREVRGVKIYNDNNATTPEATLAGLKAVAEGKNVVLIMGGADKGSDYSELLAALPQYAKDIVLLAGTGTDRIKGELPDAPVCTSLSEAFATALDRAENGDVVLFSPAFASFGMFKNEYERNDQFVVLVQKLT